MFKVTHLIIPQQEGNSDNFVTRNEEEYFEEMEKHDLIQLGWIHVSSGTSHVEHPMKFVIY